MKGTETEIKRYLELKEKEPGAIETFNSINMCLKEVEDKLEKLKQEAIEIKRQPHSNYEDVKRYTKILGQIRGNENTKFIFTGLVEKQTMYIQEIADELKILEHKLFDEG